MSSPESLLRLAQARRPKPAADKICIEGDEVVASSPEGQIARMPLGDWLAAVAPPRLNSGNLILPDGIKAVLSDGPATIWVHETPPCLYHFRWIANDSPAPFGAGARYRSVRLALPYLVLLAVFIRGPRARLQLSSLNECFFRVAPLKSLDDDLSYPALLNCSKFDPPEGRPLSWICTQHLAATREMHSADENVRLRAGFEALRHCLLETAFNHSSEHHEGASWFGESCRLDPRLQSVEAWETASAQESLFVLNVPWLPTGHTLRQLAQRIFNNLQGPRRDAVSAATLARVIFNQSAPCRPSP